MKKKLFFLVVLAMVLVLALASCRGRKVTGLEIVEGTFKYEYEVGETVDLSGLKVKATYNDGSTQEVTADKLTLSAIDTSTAGTKKFTITFEGFTLELDNITVKKSLAGSGYRVLGVNKPESLTKLEAVDGQLSSKIAAFLDHSDVKYVIGDDNPFRFSLTILALDENNRQVDITSYTSASKVYIIENGTPRLLEGDEYDLYIDVIDETKNTFDFSEAAVGKTFKIETRPAEGVNDASIAAFTRSHTFEVVNAWNIHNVKELNVLTNVKSSNYEQQVAYAQQFLTNNGFAVPTGAIAGIVLHDDFMITQADIPQEYLIDSGEVDANGNKIYNLYNDFSVFSHTVDYQNADGEYEFTIHGNYYAIFSYGIPLTNKKPNMSNEAFNKIDPAYQYSSSCLISVRNDASSTAWGVEYDNHKFNFNMENVYLMDDNPNNPAGSEADSDRAMRGLAALDVRHIDAMIDNVVIERYLVSVKPQYDFVDVTINKCKFYNAWQNHIFVIGDNNIQRDWQGGAESMDPITTATPHNPEVDIVDSEITMCGGPVIITQTVVVDGNNQPIKANSKSSPDVRIDTDTVIYTYVNSRSAWFQAVGATGAATLIETCNIDFKANGKSFQFEKSTNNGQSRNTYMNIIMVSMPAGQIGGGGDVDGTLTVGEKQILNMADSNLEAVVAATMPTAMAMGITDPQQVMMGILGGQIPPAIPLTGNVAVDLIVSQAAAINPGAIPPVFQSTYATEGAGTLMSTAYCNPLTPGAGLITAMPKEIPTTGLLGTTDGYLSIYAMGMGIVLGNFHTCTGSGDGVCD